MDKREHGSMESDSSSLENRSFVVDALQKQTPPSPRTESMTESEQYDSAQSPIKRADSIGDEAYYEVQRLKQANPMMDSSVQFAPEDIMEISLAAKQLSQGQGIYSDLAEQSPLKNMPQVLSPQEITNMSSPPKQIVPQQSPYEFEHDEESEHDPLQQQEMIESYKSPVKGMQQVLSHSDLYDSKPPTSNLLDSLQSPPKQEVLNNSELFNAQPHQVLPEEETNSYMIDSNVPRRPIEARNDFLDSSQLPQTDSQHVSSNRMSSLPLEYSQTTVNQSQVPERSSLPVEQSNYSEVTDLSNSRLVDSHLSDPLMHSVAQTNLTYSQADSLLISHLDHHPPMENIQEADPKLEASQFKEPEPFLQQKHLEDVIQQQNDTIQQLTNKMETSQKEHKIKDAEQRLKIEFIADEERRKLHKHIKSLTDENKALNETTKQLLPEIKHLQQIVVQAEIEVGQLRSQLQQAQTEKEAQDEVLKSKEEEIESLNKLFETNKNYENDTLKQSFVQLGVRADINSKLFNELEQVKAQLAETGTILEAKDQQLAELKGIQDKLNTEKEEFQKEIEQLSTELTERAESGPLREQELQSTIVNLYSQVSELQQQLQAKNSEEKSLKDELERQLQTLQSEINLKQQELDQAQQKTENLVSQINALTNEKIGHDSALAQVQAQLDQQIQEQDPLKKQLQTLQSEINLKQQELDQEQQKSENLVSQINALTNEKIGHDFALAQVQAQLAQQMQEQDPLKKQLQTLQAEIDQKQQELDQEQQKSENLVSQINALTNEKIGHDTALAHIQAQLDQQIQEQDPLKKQLQTLQSEINLKQQELDQELQKTENLVSQINALTNEKVSHDSALAQVQAQLDQQIQEQNPLKEELQTKQAQYEDLLKENESNLSKISELKQQIDQINDELDQRIKNEQELQEDVARLERAVDTNKSFMTDELQKSTAASEQFLTEAKLHKQLIEERIAEVAKLEDQLQLQNTTITELQDRISGLERKEGELQGHLDDAKSKLEEAQLELQQNAYRLQGNENELKQMLLELEDQVTVLKSSEATNNENLVALKDQVKMRDQKLKEYRLTINNVESKNQVTQAQLEEQVEELKGEVTEQQKLVVELTAQIDELRVKNTEQDESQKLISSIEDLTKQIAQVVADKDIAEAAAQSLKNELAVKLEELTSLKQANESMQTTIDNQTHETEQLHSQIDILVNSDTTQKTEIARLTDNSAQQQHQLSTQSQAAEELQQQIDALTHRLAEEVNASATSKITSAQQIDSLKDQLAALRESSSGVEELTAQLGTSEIIIQQLKLQYSRLEAERDDQVRGLEERASSLLAQMKASQIQLRESDAALASSKQELGLAHLSVKDLEQQVDLLKTTIDGLKSQHQQETNAFEERLKALQVDAAAKDKKFEGLLATIAETDQKVSQQRTASDKEFQATIRQLEQRLEDTNAQLAHAKDMEKQVDELRTQNQLLLDESDDLRTQLVEQQRAHETQIAEQTSHLENQVAQALVSNSENQARLRELRQQLELAEQQREDTEINLKVTQDKLQGLVKRREQEIAELGTQIEKSNAAHDSDLQQFQNQLVSLTDQLAQKAQEMDQLRRKLNEHEDDKRVLLEKQRQSESTQLNQIASLKTQLEAMDGLKQKIENDLKRECSSLQKDKQQLLEENARQQLQLDGQEDEITQLSGELQHMRSQNDQLVPQMLALENEKNEQIMDLASQKQRLVTQVRNLKEEIESMRQVEAVKPGEVESLSQQLEQSKNELDRAVSQLEELAAEVDQLKQELQRKEDDEVVSRNTAAQMNRDFEQLINENERISIQMQRQSGQIISFKQCIEDQEVKIKQLSNELERATQSDFRNLTHVNQLKEQLAAYQNQLTELQEQKGSQDSSPPEKQPEFQNLINQPERIRRTNPSVDRHQKRPYQDQRTLSNHYKAATMKSQALDQLYVECLERSRSILERNMDIVTKNHLDPAVRSPSKGREEETINQMFDQALNKSIQTLQGFNQRNTPKVPSKAQSRERTSVAKNQLDQQIQKHNLRQSSINKVTKVPYEHNSITKQLLPAMAHTKPVTYKGDYLNGMKHGRGKYTYENGESYEGEWYKDQRYGYGTLKNSTGDIYLGYWQFDEMNGCGHLRNKTIDQCKTPIDYQQLDTIGSKWVSYQGEFQNGQFHGYGTLTISNGERFHGSFLNGKANGTGTFYRHNGEIIPGQWKNNLYIDKNYGKK